MCFILYKELIYNQGKANRNNNDKILYPAKNIIRNNRPRLAANYLNSILYTPLFPLFRLFLAIWHNIEMRNPPPR